MTAVRRGLLAGACMVPFAVALAVFTDLPTWQNVTLGALVGAAMSAFANFGGAS